MISGDKILITGVSSGIGRVLVKKLTDRGNLVWGIARRQKLLLDLKNELSYPQNFKFYVSDFTKGDSWVKIIQSLKTHNFIPDIVIFNAAIFENDLKTDPDFITTRRIIQTNYLSIIQGLETLLPILRKGSQVIAISSSSAIKGSGAEGIGYASSKAALSISFENLYLKYKNKILFKTIFFGPINTDMNPLSKRNLLTLSKDNAVNDIIRALQGKKAQYYFPLYIFLIIKLVKLLPNSLYFMLLEMFDNKFHQESSE